jgi:hypothetical protein
MDVRVDPRVEVFSIVFHLAGSPEFVAFDTPYRRAVDSYFAAFSGHPAIAATRELRAKHGISYNAPASLAVFLDEGTLEPTVDLDRASELDPRWHDASIAEYLDVIRAFASETKIQDFFAAQHDYYEQVAQRLRDALANEQIEPWFKTSFVGTPAPLIVIPGLLTGPWNYEASTHDTCGRAARYQVIELENADDKGLPAPTRTTTELVAHEIAHAHINPIVERHRAELEAVAGTIYERVRAKMEQQAYPSAIIMIEESLVRAITALFTRDRLGKQAASELVREDQARGFTWNIELAKFLDRQPRPIDLERLMPDLLAWFREVTT